MKARCRYFRADPLGDVTMVTPTAFDFFGQEANVEMKKELTQYVRDERPAKLLVNFENVQRFSTEFIGTLLSVKKLLDPDGEIKLCSMEFMHREVFQLLNLDGTVFDIYDTIEEACEAFRRAGAADPETPSAEG